MVTTKILRDGHLKVVGALVLALIGLVLGDVYAQLGQILPVKIDPGPLVFELSGTREELLSLSNGAGIVPKLAPADVKGKLVIRGRGSINLLPNRGVWFTQTGQQNASTAFYQFTGPGIVKLFNTNGAGEVSFTWTSRYSFEERQRLQETERNRLVYRTPIDVYNDCCNQLSMNVTIENGRLGFTYKLGNAGVDYYYLVPRGQEESVFGKDVALKVKLAWDGKENAALYLNGNAIHSSKYVKPSATWDRASFAIGARDQRVFGGGFWTSDDAISDLQVRNVPAPRDTEPPVIQITKPVNRQTISGTLVIYTDANDNDQVASMQYFLDGKLFSTLTAPPFRNFWDTRALPDGTHELKVIGFDGAGNQAASTVTVNVQNAAARQSDTTPPGAITGFRTVRITSTEIAFQWLPAEENAGVTKYNVYRDKVLAGTVNGAEVGSSGFIEFSDKGLKPGIAYLYQVNATDAAGNESDRSSQLLFATKERDGRTLTVGPNGQYPKPCAAFAVSRPWDTVEIDARGNGGYDGDVCAIVTDNLTIRGMNGRASVDAHGQSAEAKAIWVVRGRGLLVENMTMSGAAVRDNNGAAIRAEGANITLRNVYFHHNQDGILTAVGTGGQVLIEYSEFAYNGAGDGRSHAMYIADVDSFTLRYSYVHHENEGHLVKSRAKRNYILYNRLTDETGNASYETNLPNAGLSFVIGNIIQQSATPGNSHMIAYGEEGITGDNHLYIINNTFFNSADRTIDAMVLNPGNSIVLMQNNVYLKGQAALVSNPANLQLVTNIAVDIGMFPRLKTFDFALSKASGAVGAGTAQPQVQGQLLVPSYEYVHPMSGKERPTSSYLDAGALRPF